MTKRYQTIREVLLDLHSEYPYKKSAHDPAPEVFRLWTWVLLSLFVSSYLIMLLMLAAALLSPNSLDPLLIYLPASACLSFGILLSGIPFELLVYPYTHQPVRSECSQAYRALIGRMILSLACHGAMSMDALTELQNEAERIRMQNRKSIHQWTGKGTLTELVFWVPVCIVITVVYYTSAGTQPLGFVLLLICSLRLLCYVLLPFVQYARTVRTLHEEADAEMLLYQYLQEIKYCIYETRLACRKEKQA